MRLYVHFQTLCNPRTWKIGRYFYCWIFQFLLKFGDHLKLKIRRGAQILVLQSHSEVVKMSSILFFGAESSTKITGGRKTLKNKFLQKFLQGSTFTTAKNSRFLELRDFKLFKQIVLIDLLLGPFYFFGSSIW